MNNNSNQPSLVVQPFPDWQSIVPDDLVQLLLQKQFATPDSDEHFVINLSATASVTVMQSLYKTSSMENECRLTFSDIVNDLTVLNDNIGIIGHVALPSLMDIAVTDLSIKKIVFCLPALNRNNIHKLHGLKLKTMALYKTLDGLGRLVYK